MVWLSYFYYQVFYDVDPEPEEQPGDDEV
jgi:hypothetical protein